MSARLRVLLVDDQQLVRTGFRMILENESDIDVVGEAENGSAAVAAVGRLRPDVVVMDLQMPVMDGVQATQAIAAEAPQTRVLVLTTFDADENVVKALRAGASGFLLKDVEATDFVRAIRIVSSGEALLAPSVTRRLLERFAAHLARPATETADLLRALTQREVEVLTLVARGRGNREIAEELSLAEATVKTHVSHLLLKLDVRDRAQLVILAYESGLVTPGSGERHTGE